MTINKRINVLDNGYVILKDVMGSDLTVANAARVSYAKESTELTERDKKLISFLAREGHTSPFRHAMAQFEIYAPLMVARQWWKYVVGSDHTMDAWNESSRRYVTEEPVFYMPHYSEWRSAPANSKQGSGQPVDELIGMKAVQKMDDIVTAGLDFYDWALANGICAEQARLFLPAYGMYVRWWWTGSLQSVMHFLAQRLEHDSQKEIQDFAKAILTLVEPYFPESVKHFV